MIQPCLDDGRGDGHADSVGVHCHGSDAIIYYTLAEWSKSRDQLESMCREVDDGQLLKSKECKVSE